MRPDAHRRLRRRQLDARRALVGAKLRLPVAHVEAGLRSFDWTMPEEINRSVTDPLARLLFVTSPEGVDNLRHEGVPTTGSTSSAT